MPENKLNEIINHLNSLTETIINLSKEILPLKYAQPINLEAEKKHFFNETKINPEFKYSEPGFDIENLRLELVKLEMPSSEMGNILDKKRNILLSELEIIDNLGNEQICRKLSQEIYGKPSKSLLMGAIKILDTFIEKNEKLDVSSKTLKENFEKELNYYGLKDWKVEYSEKILTTVNPVQKIININKQRKFSKKDIPRLTVHEIGVHVLRAVNGFSQEIKLFGLSFPNYISTEEGLASYFEEKTGNSNTNMLREYSGRVLAVDSVVRNLTFRETFDLLKSYGFSDDNAWNLSLRAHRGGGYIKDHIYLEGYLKVKKFVNEGGDLKKLFVGKIGIEDLELVNELLADGVISTAKYLPKFI